MSAVMDYVDREEPIYEMAHREFRRGDIWFAELPPALGSTQSGFRPVVLLSNNLGNKYSPVVGLAAAITSSATKAKLPTHVLLEASECGLHKDSIVLVEQIFTLDKWLLLDHKARLSEETMQKIDLALIISSGLDKYLKGGQLHV